MAVGFNVAQDTHPAHLLGIGTVLGDDDLVVDGIQHGLARSLLFGVLVVFPQVLNRLQEEARAIVDVAADKAASVAQAAAGRVGPTLYLLEAFFQAEKYVGLALKTCVYLLFIDCLFVD